MGTNEARRRTASMPGSDARPARAIPLLRALLLVQAGSLLIAAALHSGIVIPGPFEQAAIYEGSLGVILALAFGLTFLAPTSARAIAVAAQGLTLVGASLGLYLALRGAAPDTPLDIVYHVALIGLLLVGIGVAWRVPTS